MALKNSPATLHLTPSLLPSPPHMSPLRRLLPLRRRLSSVAAATVQADAAAAWARAPVRVLEPATADGTLFHVAVDVSGTPDLAASHVAPGQYLQLRLAGGGKPAFLAIASPPGERGEFEFLVKRVPGSTAEALCGMRKGEVVELSAVMGRGFDVGRISPPEAAQSVLIFATGSGISAIRSLLESGFGANERTDVRLYYGARSLNRMAYQDRFKDWELSGVRIVPVLSRPEDKWDGELGYVQAAFMRAKQIQDPSSTGAVLCGHKQMAEEVTSALTADGVSKEKILLNF